jgi:hypothetical protein
MAKSRGRSGGSKAGSRSRGGRSGRPAFGGFSIKFAGADDSLESVFGSQPIGPAEMTKKLWAYVKRKKLSGKS